MKDGTKQTEMLEQIWVAYEETDKPALRELVAQFCTLLSQEAMYLEFTDSVIEFIPPHSES
jgi:hypothetical protein